MHPTVRLVVTRNGVEQPELTVSRTLLNAQRKKEHNYKPADLAPAPIQAPGTRVDRSRTDQLIQPQAGIHAAG